MSKYEVPFPSAGAHVGAQTITSDEGSEANTGVQTLWGGGVLQEETPPTEGTDKRKGKEKRQRYIYKKKRVSQGQKRRQVYQVPQPQWCSDKESDRLSIKNTGEADKREKLLVPDRCH